MAARLNLTFDRPLRIAKQLKPDIDFLKAQLSRAFKNQCWILFNSKSLVDMPIVFWLMDSLPFQLALGHRRMPFSHQRNDGRGDQRSSFNQYPLS
jgi:hypothetical protein